ncbi:MAG: hypothetical protein ACYDFT_05600 [Thermoplasmata archaeon]
MNRVQPCPECGCPILFHRTPRDAAAAAAGQMACSQCRTPDGSERLCSPGTDG